MVVFFWWGCGYLVGIGTREREVSKGDGGLIKLSRTTFIAQR